MKCLLIMFINVYSQYYYKSTFTVKECSVFLCTLWYLSRHLSHKQSESIEFMVMFLSPWTRETERRGVLQNAKNKDRPRLLLLELSPEGVGR